MADTELAALTEDTAPASTDWFYKVDSGGTADRKVSRENMRGYKVVRKSSDETVTSSSTLQDDDTLLFAAAANEVWVAEWVLFVTAGASNTPDIKCAIVAPTGATGGWGIRGTAAAQTQTEATMRNVAHVTLDGSTTVDAAVVASATNLVTLWASVALAGTAGNIKLQWAQSTSDGTGTVVKAGSFLMAHRVD